MNTVGIIAEYNPLHNGHLYQINEARRITNADFVIVAMSGNFVQRGEPSIYDKYTRTRMALNAGADLVLEIPSCFATGSAEDFASCGVALLSKLGIVDTLCFGSECGDVKPLMKAAEILAEEPAAYKDILKNGLAEGKSFPKARVEAVMSVLDGSAITSDVQKREAFLSSPNNILGMEYCKALIRQNSHIQPLTILRHGAGYHSTEISFDDTVFASASAIRKALSEGNLESAGKQMPFGFDKAMPPPVFTDDFSELLNYRLLDLYHSGTELTVFSDVSKELADRLEHQILEFDSFSSRIQSLKTRQYTYTRVSRTLLHILLGIRNDDIQTFRIRGYAEYARILGFKKSTIPLLSEIKVQSAIPLISKVANAKKILEKIPTAWRAFQYDLHTAHVYQTIQQQKCGVRRNNEFTQPMIILDI